MENPVTSSENRKLRSIPDAVSIAFVRLSVGAPETVDDADDLETEINAGLVFPCASRSEPAGIVTVIVLAQAFSAIPQVSVDNTG